MELLKNSDEMLVSARDVHGELGIKQLFSTWIKKNIQRACLEINKDFLPYKEESTGGRPSTDYGLRRDAAISIVVISGGVNAKNVRDEIIKVFTQRENLELVTVKEAALAVKVVNCLKYVENQKEAYAIHRNAFVTKNKTAYSDKWIYAEFAKYRASITGWDKKQVDEAISNYLSEHVGYNKRKIGNADMATKMSIMDIGEAIRIAVLDILFSKDTDENLAGKFSELCKRFAKEMNVEPDKNNQNTLFKTKNIEAKSVKEISNYIAL